MIVPWATWKNCIYLSRRQPRLVKSIVLQEVQGRDGATFMQDRAVGQTQYHGSRVILVPHIHIPGSNNRGMASHPEGGYQKRAAVVLETEMTDCQDTV